MQHVIMNETLVAIIGGSSPGTDLGNAVETLVKYAKQMNGVKHQNRWLNIIQKAVAAQEAIYGKRGTTPPRAHHKIQTNIPAVTKCWAHPPTRSFPHRTALQ